jgi:hypothetical protein
MLQHLVQIGVTVHHRSLSDAGLGLLASVNFVTWRQEFSRISDARKSQNSQRLGHAVA